MPVYIMLTELDFDDKITRNTVDDRNQSNWDTVFVFSLPFFFKNIAACMYFS